MLYKIIETEIESITDNLKKGGTSVSKSTKERMWNRAERSIGIIVHQAIMRGLIKDVFRRADTPIYDADYPVDQYLMNFDTFSLLRSVLADDDFGSFDPVTDRGTLEACLYGKLWGVNIYIDRSMPFGKITAVSLFGNKMESSASLDDVEINT